ncbi:MAG: hypothetical protein HC944_01790, partial [Nanoarchaeota archaeon]|nr:hypothetical protein [Nanoarchaeota archaeon]
MKTKVLFPIVIGIGITMIFAVFLTSQPTGEPILRDMPKENNSQTLSYVDSNSVLKSSLAENKILMSSPLKFTGESVEKYCTFYQNEQKQNLISYCTSTELKDPDGKFLGNIHMVGNNNSPDAILGVIQTDPNFSNLD